MTNIAGRRELNVDVAIKKIENAIDGLRVDKYELKMGDPKSFCLTLIYQGREMNCDGHVDRLLRLSDGHVIGCIKKRLGLIN